MAPSQGGLPGPPYLQLQLAAVLLFVSITPSNILYNIYYAIVYYLALHTLKSAPGGQKPVILYIQCLEQYLAHSRCSVNICKGMNDTPSGSTIPGSNGSSLALTSGSYCNLVLTSSGPRALPPSRLPLPCRIPHPTHAQPWPRPRPASITPRMLGSERRKSPTLPSRLSSWKAASASCKARARGPSGGGPGPSTRT